LGGDGPTDPGKAKGLGKDAMLESAEMVYDEENQS